MVVPCFPLNLFEIGIALSIWKIYYSVKLDFSKIQFWYELYVCMHDIRQKTKEGNIKNMSIFHDWTSHKKPCDHQWSYSSVNAKRHYSWNCFLLWVVLCIFNRFNPQIILKYFFIKSYLIWVIVVWISKLGKFWRRFLIWTEEIGSFILYFTYR